MTCAYRFRLAVVSRVQNANWSFSIEIDKLGGRNEESACEMHPHRVHFAAFRLAFEFVRFGRQDWSNFEITGNHEFLVRRTIALLIVLLIPLLSAIAIVICLATLPLANLFVDLLLLDHLQSYRINVVGFGIQRLHSLIVVGSCSETTFDSLLRRNEVSLLERSSAKWTEMALNVARRRMRAAITTPILFVVVNEIHNAIALCDTSKQLTNEMHGLRFQKSLTLMDAHFADGAD